MRSRYITFGVFFLCSFAVMAMAQNPSAGSGDANELKDVTTVFVDTGTDMNAHDNIIAEIRKKLREAKRDLKFVSKPEDSDIHLRFSYEVQAAYGGTNPKEMIRKTAVGKVVKILGKDRERVLMSYKGSQRNYGIKVGLGKRNPEIEFAREFVKAYLYANSKNQGQPARQLSS